MHPSQYVLDRFMRSTLGYCINEFMKENTLVHRCLVLQDITGIFHARNVGR